MRGEAALRIFFLRVGILHQTQFAIPLPYSVGLICIFGEHICSKCDSAMF